MFDQLHHVAIIVSDIERSKQFYTQVLRLEKINEVWRPDKRSWKVDLRLPDGRQIEMFDFSDSPQRVTDPEAQGLRHLAFGSKDPSEEWLHVAGFQHPEPMMIDRGTGKRYFFFKDPDGLPIEVYEL